MWLTFSFSSPPNYVSFTDLLIIPLVLSQIINVYYKHWSTYWRSQANNHRTAFHHHPPPPSTSQIWSGLSTFWTSYQFLCQRPWCNPHDSLTASASSLHFITIEKFNQTLRQNLPLTMLLFLINPYISECTLILSLRITVPNIVEGTVLPLTVLPLIYLPLIVDLLISI